MPRPSLSASLRRSQTTEESEAARGTYRDARAAREAARAKRQVWFEYRCWEDHDSSDAQAWYRSHQRVTVTGPLEADEDEPGVYPIRFADGFEYHAWEDELVDGPADFIRPDPPPSPLKKQERAASAALYPTTKRGTQTRTRTEKRT